MTHAEVDAAAAMLSEAMRILPADLRLMVRVGSDLDILDGDWYLSVSVQHGERRGGLVDDGCRPVGSEGSLRDVSAEALAARLEGLIRSWLAKHG
jgi:hypothetical protein